MKLTFDLLTHLARNRSDGPARVIPHLVARIQQQGQVNAPARPEHVSSVVHRVVERVRARRRRE